MNKRNLSERDFYSNKRNKVNLHTYSNKRLFYDSDDESSNKKIKYDAGLKPKLLIEDDKCIWCKKYLYQHDSQAKANCNWIIIYEELLGFTNGLSLGAQIARLDD
jgi:hypothetical protein